MNELDSVFIFSLSTEVLLLDVTSVLSEKLFSFNSINFDVEGFFVPRIDEVGFKRDNNEVVSRDFVERDRKVLFSTECVVSS